MRTGIGAPRTRGRRRGGSGVATGTVGPPPTCGTRGGDDEGGNAWRRTGSQSVMRQAVYDAVAAFMDKFEGKLPWMYLDQAKKQPGHAENLVTTARGNLIDPITAALNLPWKQAFTGGNFGALATRDQVVAEWVLVKALQSMADRGGGAFSKVTTLRLAPEDMDELLFQKLAENEEMLRTSF